MPKATPKFQSELMSLAEASEYVGVHSKTLRRRISDGSLTAYRMAGGSRLIRVRKSDLDAMFSLIPAVQR